MLIVSETKLRQVRDAITGWVGGVLVLRGPSGSGKMSALRHVCGNAVIEHVPEDSNLGLVAFACRLESGAINSKVVLVTRDSTELEVVTRSLKMFPHVLVVFILDESDLSYRNAQGILVISFNSFSDTAIRKLLTSAAAPSLSLDQIEHVVRCAAGDARQALIELTLIHLTSAPRRKRTRAGQEHTEPRLHKDNGFSLFHTIGKILYNKNGDKTDCESLVTQPVIADFGDVAFLTLHENVVDFVDDISVLRDISNACSFADAWFDFRSGTHDRDLFMFRSIVTRDVRGSSKSGFNAFRRSRIKDCEIMKKRNLTLLNALRSIVGRWATVDSAFFLDLILTATNGLKPEALSPEAKRLVFQIFHGDGADSGFVDAIRPKELEDDPLEDC